MSTQTSPKFIDGCFVQSHMTPNEMLSKYCITDRLPRSFAVTEDLLRQNAELMSGLESDDVNEKLLALWLVKCAHMRRNSSNYDIVILHGRQMKSLVNTTSDTALVEFWHFTKDPKMFYAWDITKDELWEMQSNF